MKCWGGNFEKAVQYVSQTGISAYIWKKPDAIMHNKFVIIDNNKLLIGSYNFQESATLRNRENMLLISDIDIVSAYSAEYKRICMEASVLEDNNLDNSNLEKEIYKDIKIDDYITLNYKRILLFFILLVSMCLNLYMYNLLKKQ